MFMNILIIYFYKITVYKKILIIILLIIKNKNNTKKDDIKQHVLRPSKKLMSASGHFCNRLFSIGVDGFRTIRMTSFCKLFGRY